MKRLIIISVAVMGLLLSACSTSLLLSESDIPTRLQQLIDGQQYRRTLLVIDGVRPNSPLYAQVQKLRQEVLASMEDYDSDVIEKTTAFSKNLQWQQADDLFKDALPRLLKSSRSHSAYQEFIEQRDQYISDQELKLNLLLGERMVEEGEYRNSIRQADPSSWSASWALKRYNSRRRDVAEYLANQGLTALDEGNYGNAKKYLKLSQQLDANENVKLALGKINDELDLRWNKHLLKREQYYQELVGKFEMTATKKELLKAAKILDELTELNPKDSANIKRREQLDAVIEIELQRAIAQGERAYSDGDVKHALVIWRMAAKLSPRHVELLQHIDRAERFLENYESLKQEEQRTSDTTIQL